MDLNEARIMVTGGGGFIGSHVIEELCKENEYLMEYDLLNNMGYGTLKHREAIEHYGVTEYHRKSFKGCH